MIWLAPAAWIGALAVVAPIVVHLLARPRVEVQPFPTLRFLPALTAASRRRRRVDDLPLLAVRCGIVLLSAAALAGPFVLTSARRAAWDARVVRETVDADGDALRGALATAIATLADAPPGRRAIVVRSAFPIGSLSDADVAAVPRGIGLAFERTRRLPATRHVEAAGVLVRSAEASRFGDASRRSAEASRSETLVERRRRFVLLDATRTSVGDADASAEPAAIEIVAPAAARPALSAVLSERVLAAPADRRVRLLIAAAPDFGAQIADARSVRVPWIADAIARIGRDPDVGAACRDLGASLDAATFARAPWVVVAANRDAKPAAAAAADAAGRLLVATASPADALATAAIIRSMLNARAPASGVDGAEVAAIADAQLRAWSRPPGPAADPRANTIDADDRRALWIAVLFLLGVETWIRRNDR